MFSTRSLRSGLWLMAALCVASAASAQGLNTLNSAEPLVIAHRGASGYLPEHTLAGYELAVKLGADYIEPDLQLTQDGFLVAMHDATLNRTTDVATVLGPRNGGYLVSSYTLAEIKQLTVKPVGTASTTYPGFTPSYPDAFRVPTFDQVLQLAQAQSAVVGRTVGIYPEAKIADPVMEDKILSTLMAFGYGQRQDKVIIQSFSLDTLQSMRTKQNALGMNLAEVFLGNSASSTFADLSGWVDGIGPSISNNGVNRVTEAYIAAAHAAGLVVHGYTFNKPDAQEAATQFATYFGWGMDGVFANYADLAVTARDLYVSSVPEPQSGLLMACGMVLLLGAAARGPARSLRRGPALQPFSGTPTV